MATIQRDFEAPAAADAVWAALRDFGAVQALAPGFVTGCSLEESGTVRVVTLAPAMEQMMERGAQAMRSALTPLPR